MTVTEGTDAIVRLATLSEDGPTGTFQDRYGTVPWWHAALATARTSWVNSAGCSHAAK